MSESHNWEMNNNEKYQLIMILNNNNNNNEYLKSTSGNENTYTECEKTATSEKFVKYNI